MALSTQRDFPQTDLLDQSHELIPMKYQSKTRLQTFESCDNVRSWKLDEQENSKWISEVVHRWARTLIDPCEYYDDLLSVDQLQQMSFDQLISYIFTLHTRLATEKQAAIDLEKILEKALNKYEKVKKIINIVESLFELQKHDTNKWRFRCGVQIRSSSSEANLKESQLNEFKRKIQHLKMQAQKAQQLEKELRCLKIMANQYSGDQSDMDVNCLQRRLEDKEDSLTRCTEMVTILKNQNQEQHIQITFLSRELTFVQSKLKQTTVTIFRYECDIKDYCKTIIYLDEELKKLYAVLQMAQEQIKSIDELKHLGHDLYLQLSCVMASSQSGCQQVMDEHIKNLAMSMRSEMMQQPIITEVDPEWQNQLKNIENSVDDLRGQLRDSKNLFKQSKKDLLDEVGNAKKFNQTLLGEVDVANKNLNKMEQILSNKDIVIDNLTESKIALTQENARLNDHLDQLGGVVDDIEKERNKTNGKIESELNAYENQLNRIARGPNAQNLGDDVVETTINDLTKMLDTQQKDNEDLRKKITELEEEKRKLKTDLTESKTKTGSDHLNEVSAKHLAMKNYDLEEELNKVREQLEQFESKKDGMEDVRDELRKLKQQFKNCENEKEALKASLSKSPDKLIREIENGIESTVHKIKSAFSLDMQSEKMLNEIENTKRKKNKKLQTKQCECVCGDVANKLEKKPIAKNYNSLQKLCMKMLKHGIESLTLDELNELHKEIFEAGYKLKFMEMDRAATASIKPNQEYVSLDTREKEQQMKVEKLEEELKLSKLVLERLRRTRCEVNDHRNKCAHGSLSHECKCSTLSRNKRRTAKPPESGKPTCENRNLEKTIEGKE